MRGKKGQQKKTQKKKKKRLKINKFKSIKLERSALSIPPTSRDSSTPLLIFEIIVFRIWKIDD
jgi:hypothetical protein